MKYEKLTNKDVISYPDSYVILNIITTGDNIYEDKILRIDAIKVIDNKRFDEYSTFINPGFKLDEETQLLTGIKNSDLSQSQDITTSLLILIAYIGNLPIIGFNTEHIINFLNYNLVNNNMNQLHNNYIDIAHLCKENIELKYYTLDEIRKYFKLKENNIYEIYKLLKERYSISLYGKLVVITGTLKMSRSDAFKIIRNLGGIPSNTVTSKTDILVKGYINHESNKLKFAKIYGTKVIDEHEFYNIINQKS